VVKTLLKKWDLDARDTGTVILTDPRVCPPTKERKVVCHQSMWQYVSSKFLGVSTSFPQAGINSEEWGG